MDKVQESEWLEAQKIGIGKELVGVAKRQLEFLGAVDRRRVLYEEGPVLEGAIYRYKTCWLPLLAKHNESGVLEGSLVVPFDCEWIWHCHRLNPVQYKKDCQKFYGRILDNQNVESSLYGKSKDQSAEIWTKLYPGEPFDLDYSCSSSDRLAVMDSGLEESITYDLVSAVKRQSTFFYQVSRPSMHDTRFLEGAVARYKGFLHLIKRNQEKSMKLFCVPTYDIDLIWHSHQLQPLAYCKDMIELLGKVLEHDDTDSDRSKGKKLDTGFSDTTKQWEDTYGSRYWRAGAMYRGSMPSPLEVTPYLFNATTENGVTGKSQKFLPLQETMAVEVLLEIVGIRNLTAGQYSNLFVSCHKKHPDMFFSGSCTLTILSECGDKQVAGFQCEPTGELSLALMTNLNGSTKTLGTTSIPLENIMSPNSKLSVEKWFELKHQSGNVDSKAVSLRVAASFTAPFPAPHVVHMFKPFPISMNTCFFPLLNKVQQVRRWARFVDDNGNDLISLQMRYSKEKDGMNYKISKRNVVGVTEHSRKPRVLAEFAENTWTLKDSNFSLYIEKKTSQGGHTFELTCGNQIKLFPGKRLDYEPKNCNQIELDFITVVEFSADHPYGKAIALLDTKSSIVKVNEEKFVLPAILLSFILKKEGFTAENIKRNIYSEAKTCQQCSKSLTLKSSKFFAAESLATLTTAKSSGCGSGCGDCGAEVSGNGPADVKSSGCGSGCGSCGAEVSGNGPAGVKSSGCGSGCGSCGAEVSGNGPAGVKSSGCGSGCGSCGAEINGNGPAGAKSSGCGSGCGSCGAELSGNAPAGVKSSGCGSGCGSCGAELSGNAPAGVKSSGCGSGCGSCGAEVSRNGPAATKGCGCGSGCGSCGAEVSGNGPAPTKSSGCGSGCGSCGAEVNGNGPAAAKSSGCGSGCGSCGAEVSGSSGNKGSGCESCGAEVGGKNVNLAACYEVAPISA